jgi:hypothetical protein
MRSVTDRLPIPRALPAGFFFLLLERLTGDTEGSDWSSLEPFVGNFLFTSFTDPVRLLLHAFKRFVYLLEQLLLAFLDPHGKILVRFRGGLIADIRERFLALPIGKAFTSLRKNRSALALKLSTDAGILPVIS